VVRADIAKAVQAAKSAPVAVVVVADDTESEGADRPDLRLPSAQNALVSAVAKVNPHTVVVIQAGAPITMPWIADVPAILDTWYPGQTDGRALANVLYGKVDPSGHLPVTFPVKLADVPAVSPARFPGVDGKVHYSEGLKVGYRWYESKHIKPLFPFGYGLSYTRFRFSDLKLSRRTVDGVTGIRVSARVTNVGPVAGADVAQLYLGMPASTGEPPRQLVGFKRVELAPGASKTVHFTITPREEWWWGHTGWTETAGTYRVYVGDSSALANLPLRGRYRMVRSIGSREVSVLAPKTFKPGVRAEVSVTLSAGGTETLGEVSVSLKAPGGWRVTPFGAVAQSKVAPKTAVTVKFAVTPPKWAVAQYVTLHGTADLSGGECSGANTHCVARRDGGVTALVSPNMSSR
jgi:beta-glucosidase